MRVPPSRPFRPVSSAARASRLHRDISWVRVPHRVRALSSVAVARARHARGRLFDSVSAHQPAFVYQLGSWAFNPRKPGQHRQAGPIASTSGSGVWATNPEWSFWGSISSAHPLRRRSPSKRPRAGLIPAWASGPVVQWTASENPNLWIQVQLLAGSPIRAADVTGNRTGLKSRFSGFESRAAHHGGHSSMAEQPAFNRSTAGPIPRAPTNLADVV